MDYNKKHSEMEEALKEFFDSKENLALFNDLMADLAARIANGMIEPLEAYYEFIDLYKRVYPKSSRYHEMRDILFDRFQTYLLIWVLREVGSVRRNQTLKRKKSTKS